MDLASETKVSVTDGTVKFEGNDLCLKIKDEWTKVFAILKLASSPAEAEFFIARSGAPKAKQGDIVQFGIATGANGTIIPSRGEYSNVLWVVTSIDVKPDSFFDKVTYRCELKEVDSLQEINSYQVYTLHFKFEGGKLNTFEETLHSKEKFTFPKLINYYAGRNQAILEGLIEIGELPYRTSREKEYYSNFANEEVKFVITVDEHLSTVIE